MKTVHTAVALALATSLGARAETHGGGHAADDAAFAIDMIFNLFSLGAEIAALDAAANAPPPAAVPPRQQLAQYDGPPPGAPYSRKKYESRQGLLMSFGIGGGSIWVSNLDEPRTGAFDLNFRLGYGFSDRFQFFMDMALEAANYKNALYGYDNVASWTFTFRGQTVLIGDRSGNGLNLNAGVGLGGLTANAGYGDHYNSQTGLAVGGGISYDARVGQSFSLSPEFFYTWHSIPDVPGTHDAANMYGLRMNFLWYLH